MSAATYPGRRASAQAEARVARERRQKMLVIAGAVLLAVVLLYEVPHTLKAMKGNSSSSSSTAAPAPTAPVVGGTASPKHDAAALRIALRTPAHDLFAKSTTSAVPSTLGTVPVPRGMRDPFSASGTSTPASPAVTTPTAAPSQLPGKLVLGAPGPGRVAAQRWIVILASIPTAQGESSAASVAASARRGGIGAVSVLNSSHRRPLRGGYWVVYTGPVASLGQANARASQVHSRGFAGAYVRGLVVYQGK